MTHFEIVAKVNSLIIYSEHIDLSMEEGGEYLTIEALATFFFSDKLY